MVFEKVWRREANPVELPAYRPRCHADDKSAAVLERLDKQPPLRLERCAWQLVKPYIADAAYAGKVGKLDLSRGEFFYDLILISYFDGRQWRSASAGITGPRSSAIRRSSRGCSA